LGLKRNSSGDQLSTSKTDHLEQVKVFVGGGVKGAFYFIAEIYTYHVLAELADQVLSVSNSLALVLTYMLYHYHSCLGSDRSFILMKLLSEPTRPL
jgi:hypothetical protein